TTCCLVVFSSPCLALPLGSAGLDQLACGRRCHLQTPNASCCCSNNRRSIISSILSLCHSGWQGAHWQSRIEDQIRTFDTRPAIGGWFHLIIARAPRTADTIDGRLSPLCVFAHAFVYVCLIRSPHCPS